MDPGFHRGVNNQPGFRLEFILSAPKDRNDGNTRVNSQWTNSEPFGLPPGVVNYSRSGASVVAVPVREERKNEVRSRTLSWKSSRYK